MTHFRPFLVALGFVCALISTSFILSSDAEQPFFMGDIVDLDTVRLHLTDCSAKGTVCLPISLGQALSLKVTDNGSPIPLNFMNGCDFDTSSAYTYSTLFGQGSFGPYDLTSWPVGGQVFSGTFNTMPELVDSMNTWDPMGNWELDSTRLLILGGNPGAVYDTMKVWVTQIATPSFIGYNLGVTPQGTELSFDRGFHTVILEDTINMMTDTLYVNVACSETINLTVGVDSTQTACVDFSDLVGNPVSLDWCNGAPTADIAQFSFTPNDSCVQITGVVSGMVSTCAVLCDDLGFCDTTYFNISVMEYGVTNHINIETGPGETGSFCFDQSLFDPVPPTLSLCGVTNNGFANLTVDPINYCLNYQGLVVNGSDTLCAVLCNQQGICDTTYLYVDVKRQGPDIIYDTLFTNFSNTHCVDQSLMTGDIVDLYAITAPDPLLATYTLDNGQWCVNYTGLTPSTDTIGVVLQDENGILDTTYIVLTVVPPSPDTIINTLQLTEVMTYCLPTNELAGSNFTVTDICSDLNGNFVTFALDTLSLCVDVEGLLLGTDTSCMVICDDLGVCDTVIFFISAQGTGNPLPPIAEPDVEVTTQNTPVVINILGNDTLNGTLSDIIVLPPSNAVGPFGGSTSVDILNGTITYTPDSAFCGSTDNFMYLLCNENACDTALVTVMVTCDGANPGGGSELVFYGGFSPNADNINDTFVIENVDQFPGNSLQVFNRWGNRVVQMSDYSSRTEWDGTWEGKPLPDGTYFYVFDDGQGNTHEGCVYLGR